MTSYASGTAKCRSVSLLEYFGEENVTRCGKCDVCTFRNELDMSKYQFDQILEKLKVFLVDNELGLEEVVDQLKFPKERSTRVIRWLLDNEKIIITDEGLLKWHKKE
jgi:ATP-dependent DNA helicase RecQ